MPKAKQKKTYNQKTTQSNQSSLNLSQYSTSSAHSSEVLSYSISYYSEKQQRKKTSGPAPESRKNLVGKTQYLTLNNQDLLYVGNLHKFKSPDFNFILRKITRDLNLLLHFKYEDFWAELSTSASLKKCLSSCLRVLPQKIYGQYVETQNQPNQLNGNQNQLQKNQTFRIFGELVRIVLFIYHRMVCQSHSEQKNIIYDNWLLDIPKIFDLIGIYKEANPKILRQILKTAFETIPNYEDDAYDFARIMVEVVLDALFKDLQFQYKQKIIQDSKNFGNPMESFTRNLVKSFFRIYDMFNLVSNFIQFFPKRYVVLLLNQPCFLLELIDAYFQYCDNIEGRWQFNQQFKLRFGVVIEKVRQSIIECFVRSFDFLDLTLRQPLVRQVEINCLKVYVNICKQFVDRDLSPRGQQWQSLINLLISQNSHRVFFIMQQSFLKKLSKRQIGIIEKCQVYQKQYKGKIKTAQFGQDEKLSLKLSEIKSFKDWKNFQNFKLEMNEQFYMDSRIYEDSILIMLQQQIQKGGLRLKQKNVQQKPLYNLASQKKKVFPYFPQQEYNDQPLEQHDENNQKYTFPLGMQRIQDIQIIEQNQPVLSKRQNPTTNIGNIKQNNRMHDNYERFYNKPQQINTSHLSQSKLSGMNNISHNTSDNRTERNLLQIMNQQHQSQQWKKKKKKNYICLSDLSIQMDPYTNLNTNSEVVDSTSVKNSKLSSRISNLVIEKLQIEKQQNIFKMKQQSSNSNTQNNKDSKSVSEIKNTKKTTGLNKKMKQKDELTLSLIKSEEQEENSVQFQNVLDEVYSSNMSISAHNSENWLENEHFSQQNNERQQYDEGFLMKEEYDEYFSDNDNYIRNNPRNYYEPSSIIDQESQQQEQTQTGNKIQVNNKNMPSCNKNNSKISCQSKSKQFEEYSDLSIQFFTQQHKQNSQQKQKQRFIQKQKPKQKLKNKLVTEQMTKKDNSNADYSNDSLDNSLDISNLSFKSVNKSKIVVKQNIQVVSEDKQDINNMNTAVTKKYNINWSDKEEKIQKQKNNWGKSIDQMDYSLNNMTIIKEEDGEDFIPGDISSISQVSSNTNNKNKNRQNDSRYVDKNENNWNTAKNQYGYRYENDKNNSFSYQESIDLSLSLNTSSNKKKTKNKQPAPNPNYNNYYTVNNPNYKNSSKRNKNKEKQQQFETKQQQRQRQRQKQRSKQYEQVVPVVEAEKSKILKKKTVYNEQW